MEPLTGDDPEQIASYRLRARLGAGGMGRVYLAFTAGGRPVAIKVIRPELGDDQDFRGRFRQEVEAARRVNGLYTAQVIDANPDANPPWLVTAYVPGPSLQQAVGEHGPLPAATVLLLMAGVAEALQAVHAAGVVHRDLKPSNVLLAADGPRVIDFGIARAIEATILTRTGMRVGSPAFMPPEQVQGLPVSPATDVFALGSVAAFAATGRLPFGTGNEQAMLYRVVHQPPDLDGCPEPLRTLIARCLAKVPAERPAPGEIISECRAQTAGQTLQIAQSWLPAAVSAGLAQHVPPFQPTLTASRPAAGPVSPAPAGAVQPAAGGVAPSGPGGAPYGGGGGGAPFPGPVPPWSAPPPGGTRDGSPWPGGLGRIIRKPLVAAALAVVAAAGIGAGVAVALSTGGTSNGTGNNASGGSAAASPPETPTSAATSPPAPASSAATVQRSSAAAKTSAPPNTAPSPNTAACVAGTWRDVDQQILVNVNGQQVALTGSGSTTTMRPDGTYTKVYDNEVLQGTANGVAWTENVQGTVNGHWAIDNGEIRYSYITSNGTYVLYSDGVYNNSGPLATSAGSVPYQCSGNTLRESFLTGGSNLYARVTT